MIRILLLLLILWMGYRLMGELMARVRAELDGGSTGPEQRDAAQTPERLVPCQQCGVHVAESRALVLPGGGEGAVVCSPRCRDLSRATGTDG